MRNCNCQPSQRACGKPGCSGKQQGCSGFVDASCTFYHLDNNKPSLLKCTNIKNGISLEKILEVFDAEICKLRGPDWKCLDLACLREDYPIKSLDDFARAVAAELCRSKPLEIETCDEFIDLSIRDGKLRACLDVESLVNAITSNPEWKAKFCCGNTDGSCSISELSIGTMAVSDPGLLILAEGMSGFAGINSGFLFQA